MAFNIMDLFGPGALNRLLQPTDGAGVQNMLMSRPDAQPSPVVAGVDPWQGMREEDVQRVDPMQTASAAQPVQQAQQNAPAGLGGLLSPDRKQFLQDMFLGWAAGSTPQQSLSLGAVQAAKGKSGRADQNQTVQFLQGKGMDEQTARMLASNPTALGDYLKNMNDPMQGLQAQKAQLEIENLRNPNAKLSETEKAYKQAVDDGFTGTRMDYEITMKEAGRNKIDINTGVKLPSGYEWLDPNDQSKGVKPIPGGPATQVPGELAARVGMGENFLSNDLPFLRKPENLEAATGPIDRAQAWAGYGKPAEIQRKFQSGVEVLSRLLSGAGMTQVEIDEKTARYMPTLADGPESLKTKLDQLEAEIKAAGDAAMRGRGGSIAAQPDQNADPLGIR
jgi:outer membrane murein-binding lipoprotein Lpp